MEAEVAAARIELVLDCADPEKLAGFWSQVLGYTRRGAAGQYIALQPAEGTGPPIILQRVDEPKAAKNRMHLDVLADDIEAEATRLQALGATRTQPEPIAEWGHQWILMADPEGNEFCVCQA
jgi:predicted enzyme related to lactoylglutathione lyase